ncbi:MAG: TonB-dependent receptor [Bacteroidia bacterium]|nr:TonB-dependent receptor [Bacteroidia bacterium]
MRIITLLFFLLVSAAVWGGNIRGIVLDAETNQPLEGAQIYLNNTRQGAVTSHLGKFSFEDIPAGEVSFTIRYISYETKTLAVTIPSSGTVEINTRLTPGEIQLDEVVIAATTGPAQMLRNIPALDIRLRPVRSSQDILQMVPGLFIAQHAGGGKAEQIFLRGFDIDHGTDISLSVDGMPVNMVSHAHGQGYADLHFLIPEVVEDVHFQKGVYDAATGNFATAGQVAFHTEDFLRESQVKLEAGQYGLTRLMSKVKLLSQDNRQMYAAGEWMIQDGYFESSQNFHRSNVLLKYTEKIADNQSLTVSAAHFRSRWDASGQIPSRAIEAGTITRWGAIDNTEGGETSRSHINVQFVSENASGAHFRQQLYWIKYNFELYSNFTFFLEDPLNGDQIRQRENREILGYQSSYDQTMTLGNMPFRFESGVGIRADQIRDNELSHTLNRREVLDSLVYGDIDEVNMFGFVRANLELHPQLNLELGARYDQFRFVYANALTPTYNRNGQSKGILSGKMNLTWSPAETWQFYLRTGTGFHSNDTRVILGADSREILPRAIGTDLGFFVKPLPKMIIQAAIWGLYLEQEFVYVGDAGIVEPSGKTQRSGVDITLRYQLMKRLYGDVDVNFTRPKALEVAENEAYIPLAPVFSSTGGLSWQGVKGLSASLRYRWLGDRSANEDYSLTASGYFLLDAQIGYRLGPWELSVQAENLLDAEWREAQFETESRLREENESVSEIHFTPGSPRFLRTSLSFFF